MHRSRSAQSPVTPKIRVSNSQPSSNSNPSKKFRSAGQTAGYTSQPSKMLGENRFNHSTPQTNTTPDPFSLPPYGKTTTQTTTMDDNDRSSVSDNDSVQSPQSRIAIHSSTNDDKPKPAPGKKTRGRVKIEMQYIQNKLRRYTTFSKRKSGIMKKAYELSTLTGTQVMLLVASETGHVYTFATPKLQPMITSEAGKALIQTCLHTPDPPQQISEYDMRMSASGYEETELGYTMSDDDAFKTGLEISPTHLIQSGHMQPGSVVAIPHGMMPFAPVTMHEASQQMSTIMHPSPYPLVTSSGPTMSPHTNSPPPSYSPTHPPSPPRNYPSSPPYSQSSHLPHQHMIMDDLTTGSPLRKTPPETHYLSHPYERSPSHSPMTHFPVRTHSPPHSSIYAHASGSPPIGNHSPMGHYTSS